MTASGWLGPIVTPAAVGSAGVATSNITTPVCVDGAVKTVMFTFGGVCPVGTIVTTLATAGIHAPAMNIVVLTNIKTTTPLQPRLPAQDLTGTNLLYAVGYKVDFPIEVDDHLILTVAGVNAGDYVTCWILFDNPRIFM